MEGDPAGKTGGKGKGGQLPIQKKGGNGGRQNWPGGRRFSQPANEKEGRQVNRERLERTQPFDERFLTTQQHL